MPPAGDRHVVGDVYWLPRSECKITATGRFPSITRCAASIPDVHYFWGSFALKVGDIRFDTMSRGGAGYASAKHGVVGLMRYYANSLGERNIRANTVNPTGVRTPMVVNE